jgi:[NiFe] hydrogenase diaphorase moiety large subunit
VVIEGMVSFYAFFSDTPKGLVTIRLCDDIIDQYAGVEAVANAFRRELGIDIGETSEDGLFSLEYTPCIGMCDQAPAVLVNEVVLTSVDPASVPEIVASLRDNPDPNVLVRTKGDGNNTHPLINAMVKNNIHQRGELLLGEIGDNAGLKLLGSLKPEEVIARVQDAGLRGLGGAGFPTGKKWQLSASVESEQRYIICNADEGEPGTFKDRVLLTERAGLMIEGMTIAAYAVGATRGIIYLRAEYEYLRGWLEHCLQERRSQGWLGQDIAGIEGFEFDVRIQMGAGAYICGEESALISSCEGQRGEPRNRPPFPAESGYLGYPTCVDNVETFCCVPRIIEKGPNWFGSLGTGESRGSKLLSVCGDCQRPGIYEVPFGIRVSELMELVGAEDAAAIMVGGPSGQIIGQQDTHRRICFEDLRTNGAVIVFNSRRNIMQIVHHYMSFFVDESCGYCTPCRVGNVFLKKRIEKVMNGLAEPSDLDYLKELAETVIATSRCGLGQTSPNPVLSTIRNFPLVYSALLKEPKDGEHAYFSIQQALDESRHLAKRRSMIYDPTYSED